MYYYAMYNGRTDYELGLTDTPDNVSSDSEEGSYTGSASDEPTFLIGFPPAYPDGLPWAAGLRGFKTPRHGPDPVQLQGRST